MASEPSWLTESQLIQINRKFIAEPGEGDGVRDHSLLSAVIARPREAWAAGEQDVVRLAGTLLLAVGRDRPFAHANRRTALSAATIFLLFNGYSLVAPDGEPLGRLVALAIANTIPEDVFRRTLRKCTIPTADWEEFKRSQDQSSA